jgi:hypothetical protein
MTRPRIRRTMTPQTTLREALSDPALLGDVLSGDSWKGWRVLLIAAMGEPLDDAERALFKTLTGRDHEPLQRVEELVGAIGRRGGKSRAISVLAAYLGGLCRHPMLVPGERGIVLVIAPDMAQADIVLNYCEAAFRQSPVLRSLIEVRNQRELRLTNGITIEVRGSDFRRLRGPTYIAVIADEVAFWLNENSSNPDSEILNAVRPGLATTHGPLFLISSPYARRGELWRLFDRHYGPNGDPLILVAQGSSRTFNPSLDQRVVDRAMERDPVSASAEYGAQFRSDIEGYVNLSVARNCISDGVFERAPSYGISYVAFCDPSGGSQDSMTLAIAHFYHPGEVVIVDAIREAKPPFSPEQVVHEFADLLKSYRVSQVIGDKYGGSWCVEMFAKCGILYDPSAEPKSTLYVGLLALLNSLRIHLLDSQRLIDQLVGLERRVARGNNRENIDHAPGGHDDVANSIAGVAAVAVSKHGMFDASYAAYQSDFVDHDASGDRERPFDGRAFRTQQLYAFLNGMVLPR